MTVTSIAETPGREHGTRSCYVHGPGPGSGRGCRCEDCKAANRRGQARESRLKAYGRWEPYVDAGPAREHVRMLGRHGLGHRRVAELAGISNGSMSKLLYPMGSRPPSRRIRAATEAAILAVRPGVPLAASAMTDATGTRRRMQALVACGWSQAKLASRLGMTLANFISMLARERVTASTARAAAALYDELWNAAPDESNRWARTAAARARNMAAARGWPPPLAFDDDRIDDPDALPAEGWQRRRLLRSEDVVADFAELEAQGYSREHAARRMGITRTALEAAIARVRKQRQEQEGSAA